MQNLYHSAYKMFFALHGDCVCTLNKCSFPGCAVVKITTADSEKATVVNITTVRFGEIIVSGLRS